ncbi:MAG: Imm32 family immunity protein [Planctomycetota bacterium]
MSEKFRKPDFSKYNLELRFENNVGCIYGTAEGLKKIADLCHELIENPNQGHIHLEDYAILTKESERGAIAIFDKE